MLERETLQHSSIVKPHSLLFIAILAALVGCGDSQKNAGPDAQQIEHDKEIARLEQKWGRLADEKELAEKTANAEAKRLAFERAKLEIEKETFEMEKKRLIGSQQPPAAVTPAVVRTETAPATEPAADIAKAEVEKARVENERATVQARADADDKGPPPLIPNLPAGIPKSAPVVAPAPKPVQPFTSLPPKATPTPTPRPYERGSGSAPEKGLRPVKLQPSSGL